MRVREQSRTPNDVCACARPELHAHGSTRVCSAEGKLGYHTPDGGGRSPEARAGGGRREGPRPRPEPSRSMHVYWQIIRNAGWRGLSERLGLGEMVDERRGHAGTGGVGPAAQPATWRPLVGRPQALRVHAGVGPGLSVSPGWVESGSPAPALPGPTQGRSPGSAGLKG